MSRNTGTMEITLLGIMLLGIVGCTAEQPRTADSQPIGFSSYTAQAATRTDKSATRAAEEVQRNIPMGSSIGIYAYYHNGPARWSDAAQPDFMFNQQATNAYDSEAFVYSPLKYWPNESDDKISFIAYYPYSSAEDDVPASASYSPATTGVKPLLANSGSGLPTFEFTVNPDVTKQTDFLVSDLLPNLPNGTSSVYPSNSPDRESLTVSDRVHLYFRHALAKVEFRIAVHPDIRPYFSKLKLNGITMTDIKDKGTLTPSYAPATGTTLTWSNLGTTTDDAHAHTYDIDVKQVYLMIPQTLTDNAHLTLDFELTLKGYNSVYTYDAEGNAQVNDIYTYKYPDASVQLNRMKNTVTGAYVERWEPNRHYVYTIRINANRIEYTGQVVDWGDEIPVNDIKIEEP